MRSQAQNIKTLRDHAVERGCGLCRKAVDRIEACLANKPGWKAMRNAADLKAALRAMEGGWCLAMACHPVTTQLGYRVSRPTQAEAGPWRKGAEAAIRAWWTARKARAPMECFRAGIRQ